MLLDTKTEDLIKKQKVTFVKNFTHIPDNYDFNKISKLVDDNYLQVDNKPGQANHFSSIWQLYCVHKVDENLNSYFDFLTKIFKYVRDTRDGVDLFFSFVTNASHSHVDIEDVFLIGLSGKTIYRLIKEKRDYLIEKGDLLYIPKGTAHKAISLTPRIIASVGLLGGKNYD